MLLQWDVIGNREGSNGSQSVVPAKLDSQADFGQFLHQAWKQSSEGGLRNTNFQVQGWMENEWMDNIAY